jgi:hypothetical protein
MKFSLGFRQLPDARDKAFPLSALMSAEARKPISKVWKAGPLVNQLQTNGCVGYATYQFQVSEPIVGEPVLSALQIYAEARRNDEFPGEEDQGTSVRAGLNVLKAHGIIRSYHWGYSVEEAVQFMLTTGPLVFGVPWLSGMFSPDANGLIQAKGSSRGGHAIFAPSCSWKNKTITLQNSWGKEWGRAGCCKISFADLDRLLREGGVAAAVTES